MMSMKGKSRLLRVLALAALLPAVQLTACDDDENPPAPRDAGRDSVIEAGPADAGDAAPDVVAPMDVADGGSEVGDVVAEVGPVDAFPLPDAATGEQVFVATLSGAEEPTVVTTTATGAATFVLNAAKTELRYQLRHNVVNATMGHLHTGYAGENGPIAVPFTPLGPEISGTLSLTPTQAADLELGRLYANIHSTMYAGGEIRGQVLRPGEKVFVATLGGSQETPPVTTGAVGTASVILDTARTGIRYHVTTSGLVPTAAHIHKAMVRVAGDVVYPLAPLGASIDGTQALAGNDASDLETGLWYVNFHTAANPNGEIRGQLLSPGAKMYAATLSGAQETPAVTTAGTGNGMAIVNYARTQVQYHLTTSLTPTQAHFHQAAAGVAGPIVIPITPVGMVMSGTAALTPTLASNLERGLLYMNVHTTAFSGGEVRGQVIGFDETLYTAVLTGAEETPPVTTTATGGLGVMLNAAGTQVRYVGSFTNLTATMAHFHKGAVGVAGPVVYPLTFSGTTIEGTQVLTPTDLTDLEAGNWYANVHSAANPGGEIRGQVLER
jgi:hypothetical protein